MKKLPKNKAIFLDRDWTINYDSSYVYKLQDLKILDLAKEGIKKLRKLWYKLILITNQSWIWRWYYTMEDCDNFNNELQKQLWINFDWIYICPHSPDENCNCRKPKNLLVEKAVKDFDLDTSQCFFVWDKDSDIQTWINSWCKTVLIKNDIYKNSVKPDIEVESLLEFSNMIK